MFMRLRKKTNKTSISKGGNGHEERYNLLQIKV